MNRQGIDGGQPAVELAKQIRSSKHMQFEGFMAYSGGAAHTKGFEARRRSSMDVLAGVRESKDLALEGRSARQHHVRRLHRHL